MKLINLYRRYKHNRMLKRITPNLELSSKAILLDSVNFDVRSIRDDILVRIGDNSMVGCNCIFESSAGMITIGKRTYIGGGLPL